VGEALRAPASGLPCVHWRLRIFEMVAPGMELVHEVSSPEPLEIDYRPNPAEPPRRMRLAPDNTRIQAMPSLYRMGTPGALAVAQGLTLEQLEREYIERVMQAEGGNKTRAAQRLGLDRKTLYRKLDEYAASPKTPLPGTLTRPPGEPPS